MTLCSESTMRAINRGSDGRPLASASLIPARTRCSDSLIFSVLCCCESLSFAIIRCSESKSLSVIRRSESRTASLAREAWSNRTHVARNVYHINIAQSGKNCRFPSEAAVTLKGDVPHRQHVRSRCTMTAACNVQALFWKRHMIAWTANCGDARHAPTRITKPTPTDNKSCNSRVRPGSDNAHVNPFEST